MIKFRRTKKGKTTFVHCPYCKITSQFDDPVGAARAGREIGSHIAFMHPEKLKEVYSK